MSVRLPRNVELRSPDPRHAPYATLTISDDDWSRTVLIHPTQPKLDEQGNARAGTSRRWVGDDVPQKAWDSCVREALEFLLRLEKERDVEGTGEVRRTDMT